MEIPIIFITGHGDIPMTVQAMKAGAVEFLTKPFREQELLDAIQQALERDSQTREQRAEIEGLRRRSASLTPREREVMVLIRASLSHRSCNRAAAIEKCNVHSERFAGIKLAMERDGIVHR